MTVVSVISNMFNTRKSVSLGIQTLRSGLKKPGAAEFFGPTSLLFRVFDIASQGNSSRNSKQKFTEFVSIGNTYSNLLHSYEFSLHELLMNLRRELKQTRRGCHLKM